MSTNTTTEATPDQPVISALEPVDEIEPELSERLEDETEEDDRFKPGLYNITVFILDVISRIHFLSMYIIYSICNKCYSVLYVACDILQMYFIIPYISFIYHKKVFKL